MEIILRKNTTDSEMLDIVTNNLNTFTGENKEILWAVIHSDLIDDISLIHMLERNNEVKVEFTLI